MTDSEWHAALVELWTWLFSKAREIEQAKAAAGKSLQTDPAAALNNEPGKKSPDGGILHLCKRSNQ